MENQIQTITAKDFFSRDSVKNKFTELLGRRAPQFITSVLHVVASNSLLSKADPASIYQSAAVAATLDLPLNNSLGFAYIVPYNNKQPDGTYKTVAQFQIGYKGFIQLAQRSGQFKSISAAPIYEGQLASENPLTGFTFDFTKKDSDKVIGYAAYFELVNGFEKTLYMTIEDLNKHGKKFSQTFKKNFGLWKDDFDSMATKTVLKLLLSKYAPLSIDMQTAVITDQALIANADTGEVVYPDNEEVYEDAELVAEAKENDRINDFIKNAETKEQLMEAKDFLNGSEQQTLFDEKLKSFK